jgi:PAT family beta-lactamase induction signal transducer AmpG
VFFLLGAMFISLFLWHSLILPRPANDIGNVATDEHGRPAPIGQAFVLVFLKFLRKKEIVTILAFLLLYRFAESQLVKIAPVFLLDKAENGGLGLSTATVGVVYGTIGVIALTVGGLLSAWLISRHGMQRWLWPMALAINVPNAVYVYMALVLPSSVELIATLVAIEQFGYGFGFTSYVLYMIMTAKGDHQTAHYAICTGVHGAGHDAARHAERMVAVADGLQQLLHLGLRGNHSELCGDRADPHRARIRHQAT